MHAAVAALNGPQDIVDEMRESFQIRRDFILKKFNEVEGIECIIPESTFFLLSRFPNSQKNSLELTNVLLEEAGILGIPGITFGGAGERHICFSITTSLPVLEKAAEFLTRIIPTL